MSQERWTAVDGYFADALVLSDQVLEAALQANRSVQGVRRLTEVLSDEPRVTATAIQTVGSKGYDGFLLAIVT